MNKALFFYNQVKLSIKVDNSNNHTIFGSRDLPLAEKSQPGSNIKTSILQLDQQKSVIGVLKNEKPQTLNYTPYGFNPNIFPPSSMLGFNGERLDLATDTYILGNGYRLYNQTLLRFSSPDSLSPFGKGGINAYAYCANDPVNRTDPTGSTSKTAGISSLDPGNLLRIRRSSTTRSLSSSSDSSLSGTILSGTSRSASEMGIFEARSASYMGSQTSSSTSSNGIVFEAPVNHPQVNLLFLQEPSRISPIQELGIRSTYRNMQRILGIHRLPDLSTPDAQSYASNTQRMQQIVEPLTVSEFQNLVSEFNSDPSINFKSFAIRRRSI